MQRWHDPIKEMVKLAPPGGDGRGLYGDEQGLYLGPDVALIARNPADPTGFAVRPQAELERLLGAGYGADVDLTSRMAGLQAVCRALAKGAMARALICASYLRLPPLPDAAGAARIKAVERLLKYNFDPTEPRNWHGRWTNGGNSDGATGAPDKGIRVAQADIGIMTDVAPVLLASGYSSPTTGVQAADSWPLSSAPPEYRKDVLQQDWGQIIATLGAMPNLDDTERQIYAKIIAAEGGLQANGSTASGITQGLLDDLKHRGLLPDLAGVSRPADLTLSQRFTVYQRYFDDVLHSVDHSQHGSKMLNTITDGASAAAFADVLFREGRATGTAMIERAVNETIDSLPNTERQRLGLASLSVDRQMGPQVFEVYKSLANNGHGRKLRNNLGDERRSGSHKDEISRIDYFR